MIEREGAPRPNLGPGPFRLGVIGDPVSHSLSPALHQPALDQMGVPATYERWHTTHADLPERLRTCRLPDVLGANVTVPHKVAVVAHIDALSSAARRAGAVNTVVNRDGLLYGDNTDIAGFVAAVNGGMKRSGLTTALVLGAGGASRAVVLGLEAMGVIDIVVANRNESRAQEMAEGLRPAPVRAIALEKWVLEQELARADVLINATSLGWRPRESPLDLALLKKLRRDALVVDLTYRQTDLLVAAAELGRETIDGLPMLVHQGAVAFELFTGQRAPVATMYAAAERARH